MLLRIVIIISLSILLGFQIGYNLNEPRKTFKELMCEQRIEDAHKELKRIEDGLTTGYTLEIKAGQITRYCN